MCRHHSPHTYCIHTNLVKWFGVYAIAFAVNWASRQPELGNDYTFTWASGALWGYLVMWALEMAREWLKTWVPKETKP